MRLHILSGTKQKFALGEKTKQKQNKSKIDVICKSIFLFTSNLPHWEDPDLDDWVVRAFSQSLAVPDV